MQSALSRDHRAGILLTIGATILISCSDAVSKLMTAQVPVMQIALAQSVIMMLSVPVLVRSLNLSSMVRTGRLGLQLIRSVCQLASALLFFSGLKLLPLADMVALIFVGPLVVTLLAALVLKEPVGLARWCACAGGFIGALIVIRPGFGNIGWTALFPIGATSVYSINNLHPQACAHRANRHHDVLFVAGERPCVERSLSPLLGEPCPKRVAGFGLHRGTHLRQCGFGDRCLCAGTGIPCCAVRLRRDHQRHRVRLFVVQ